MYARTCPPRPALLLRPSRVRQAGRTQGRPGVSAALASGTLAASWPSEPLTRQLSLAARPGSNPSGGGLWPRTPPGFGRCCWAGLSSGETSLPATGDPLRLLTALRTAQTQSCWGPRAGGSRCGQRHRHSPRRTAVEAGRSWPRAASCSVPTPGPGHTPRASGPRAAAQLLRVLCADAVAARPQAGWEKPGHASSHSGVFGSSDVPADTGHTGAGQACSATGPRRALVGVRVRPPPAPAGTAGPMLCVWCVLKVAQAGKCKAAVLDFRPRSGRRSPGPPHARARPHIGRAAPWLHPPPLRPLAPRLPLILPSLKTQPAELSQAPESSGLF